MSPLIDQQVSIIIITQQSSLSYLPTVLIEEEPVSEEESLRQEQERVNYLDYALSEAEALLSTLEPFLASVLLQQQFEALLHYSSAITALLLPKSSPENLSYRQAAQKIVKLLVPDSSSVEGPRVSSR